MSTGVEMTASLTPSHSSSRILWTIRNVVIILGVFSGLLYFFQEKVTFFPMALPKDLVFPGIPGCQVEEVAVQTSDGLSLSAVYIRHTDDSSASSSGTLERPVILYSHGNGGNMLDRYEQSMLLASFPFDVFLYDYRGYGKNEGTPTVDGVIKDGDAALEYLLKVKKVKPEKIILYGFSLGSGVTCTILKKMDFKCAGLVLESGFASLAQRAAHRFPVIGPMVLRKDLPNTTILTEYSGPFLVMHSKLDRVIPFSDGEMLFAASPSKKKTLYEVTSGGHNDPTWRDPAYVAALQTFFVSLFPDFFPKP